MKDYSTLKTQHSNGNVETRVTREDGHILTLWETADGFAEIWHTEPGQDPDVVLGGGLSDIKAIFRTSLDKFLKE